ncbi:MAG: copper chaperone PCu(A)C [Gammaproteobacteria bacterium]
MTIAPFRLLAALLLAPTLAVAASPITITAAWARATPPGVTTAAAYLSVTNDGATDRLLGAVSPAARQVLLHSEVEEHGMQHMRQLESVEVPAHGTVEFAPGQMHLMLVDIAVPLAPDTTIEVTLRFEKAGELTIDVPVRDGRVPPENHHH